jgi:hypothetical protein
MEQQGKQMRVGAREGFAYHESKLVLLTKWLTVTGLRLIPIRSGQIYKVLGALPKVYHVIFKP